MTRSVLAEDNANTLTVNIRAQNLAASINNGFFNTITGLGFDEEDHAATAASATDLPCQGAIATRVFNDSIDGFR